MLALLCALARAGELTLETLTVGGVERTFYVHEPRRPRGDLPLVLVFHGGGTTGSLKGKGMARWTKLDALADKEHFRVVYPNSVSGNWNDGRVFDGAATSDDVAFVDAILAHYAKRTDARRIYATGASAGGFFTMRLACERAHRFAAYAPVIATLPATLDCKPSEPVSVLLIPGTKDPLVRWEGGPVANNRGTSRSVEETVQFFSTHDRCPPAGEPRLLPDTDPKDGTRIRETRTTCAAGSEVALLAVEGGGHTWPGAGQYAPAVFVGTTSHDLDASAEIWKFFANHPRAVAPPATP
jgi:polyhydroxybutyrate depolymerase